MKIKLLLSIFVITLFLGSVGSVAAEHNTEFPTNGCSTATRSIVVVANLEVLEFVIDGKVNPDMEYAKSECLEITFQNKSLTLDHDFTLVDESVDEDKPFHEIHHMDTNANTTTHHLWLLPDKDVTLSYFCEVPGHEDGGMTGKVKIGAGSSSDDGFLPGFNFMFAFLALATLIAVPTFRRRN